MSIEMVSDPAVTAAAADLDAPAKQPELPPAIQETLSKEDAYSEMGIQRSNNPILKTLWPHYPLLLSKHGLQPFSVVFKENLRPAIVVACVSLPLSASLGVASGVSAIVGIATSIWAGLVMGFFGSSDYNIVGCSGAISGMMNSNIVKWSQDIVPYLALFSAFFCLLFRVFKLNLYLFHMPSSVFQGFCIAVAIIIGLNQLNFAFRLDPGPKKEHFYENIIESLKVLPDQIHGWTTLLWFLNTALLLLGMSKKPNVPWIPISALITTVIFGWPSDEEDGPGWLKDLDILTLKSYNGGLFARRIAFPITAWSDIEDNCQAFLDLPSAIKDAPNAPKPYCSQVPEFMPVIIASFLIAFVAVLETVLAAKIASMRVDRPFDAEQEMSALTLDHTVQGVMGVMPTTGLFLRCNVNVTQGATHRISQFTNSIFMIVVILLLAPQFSFLPQFGVAAILVACSVRMVPYPFLSELYRKDVWGLFTLIFVTAACVLIDPAVGLMMGIFVAHLINANKSLSNDFIKYEIKEVRGAAAAVSSDSRVNPNAELIQLETKIIFNSPLNYVSAEKLQDALKNLPIETIKMLKMYCVEDGGVRRGELQHGIVLNMKMKNVKDVVVDAVDLPDVEELDPAQVFIMQRKAAKQILTRFEVQMKVNVDLESCHYSDFDGVGFIEKGCKLLESNSEKQGCEGSTSESKVVPGSFKVTSVMINGVATGGQIFEKFTKQGAYVVGKLPNAPVSTKVVAPQSSEAGSVGNEVATLPVPVNAESAAAQGSGIVSSGDEVPLEKPAPGVTLQTLSKEKAVFEPENVVVDAVGVGSPTTVGQVTAAVGVEEVKVEG